MIYSYPFVYTWQGTSTSHRLLYRLICTTRGQFVTRSDHISKLATVVIIYDYFGHHGKHPQIRIFPRQIWISTGSKIRFTALEGPTPATSRRATVLVDFIHPSSCAFSIFLISSSPRPRHTTTSCWNRTSRETSKIIVNNGLSPLEATEKHEWPALSRPCVSSWKCQATEVMVKNDDE